MEPVRIIEGEVSALERDDIDTDQIIPARYMKRVERTGFGEFCFHEWRQQGLDLPSNPILVTGANFGCGSSREHPGSSAARSPGGAGRGSTSTPRPSTSSTSTSIPRSSTACSTGWTTSA